MKADATPPSLVGEAGERQLARRCVCSPQALRALEDAHAPARLGEQRRADERVDAGPDEDGVERVAAPAWCAHRRARARGA